MQHNPDVFSNIYRALGLQVNVRKTEVMFYNAGPNQELTIFSSDGTQLQPVTNFKYLGSVVTPFGNTAEDVLDKINKLRCHLADKGIVHSKINNWN